MRLFYQNPATSINDDAVKDTYFLRIFWNADAAAASPKRTGLLSLVLINDSFFSLFQLASCFPCRPLLLSLVLVWKYVAWRSRTASRWTSSLQGRLQYVSTKLWSHLQEIVPTLMVSTSLDPPMLSSKTVKSAQVYIIFLNQNMLKLQLRIYWDWIKTGDDCVSIVNASSNIKMKRIYCGPGHGIR